MKIYIHTDLEGISGIDKRKMIKKNNPKRQYSIECLMADINAAIEGAFAGGATQVTVLDSHGGGGNFDYSLLDDRADIDEKENNKWWGKLDETYDGTFFIGAHAMVGTINAFLDHTQSGKSWYNYSVNGRRMGELAQWAMVAGHFDIPMLMVSGDQAACTEARAFFNPLETAVVKRGIGRNKAELVDIKKAHRRIKKAASKALKLIDKAKPFKPILPMEVKLEFTRSSYCDDIAGQDGIERLDARTVRKVVNSYLECLF
jgi:D-amino peptidase